MATDNLTAALEQLELERRRREDEKIAAGQAIRLPLIEVLPPGGDADALLEKARGNRIAALRAGGEKREVVFEDPLLIVTGVPRNTEFGKWTGETFKPQYPDRYATTTTAPQPVAHEPKAPEPPPMWKRITTQISPPDERSTGVVAEGKFAIIDGQVHVHDPWGNPLGSIAVKPTDDPAPIARKLLRDKTAQKWSAFYAPIARRVH
jgi:hypothetical protein